METEKRHYRVTVRNKYGQTFRASNSGFFEATSADEAAEMAQKAWLDYLQDPDDFPVFYVERSIFMGEMRLDEPRVVGNLGFHLRDGIYFRRAAMGGGVIICQVDAAGRAAFHVEIGSEEWLSIVASVSRRGPIMEQYAAARVFHDSDGTPAESRSRLASIRDGYRAMADELDALLSPEAPR